MRLGVAMLEADSDDDVAYEQKRQAFLRACRVLGAQARGDAVSAGLRAAAARGVRTGRPPKVTGARVRELVAMGGEPSRVAMALGVHRATVYRHLQRASSKVRVMRQRTVAAGKSNDATVAGFAGPTATGGKGSAGKLALR